MRRRFLAGLWVVQMEVGTIILVSLYHYRLVLRLGPYTLRLSLYKPGLNL